MNCNHIPVPVFEERRGDQSLVFAGYVCERCGEIIAKEYPINWDGRLWFEDAGRLSARANIPMMALSSH